MKAYVLGAGASFPCYPLGRLLLEEIDEYISSCGRCHDRFDYTKEWPEALRWLETNGNPLLRQARRTGNIEQIFTVLDFAEVLWDESMTAVLKAGKGGAETFAAAEADYENLQAEIGKYQDVRRILLRAMGAYFETRHHDDRRQFGDDKWNDLRGFAKILTDRDVVITFNYDSTVERVLWYEKKWTPRDGYGFKLDFQKDHRDRTPVEFPESRVKVFHLHGSIGWHPKPPSDDGGAVPAEIEMSLDPVFLKDLGIPAVDASMPDSPPDDYPVLLHPSFLKNYAGGGIERLWKMAADALRAAEEVVVIGYSLPLADTAAWTLLLTSCDNGKSVQIVDPDFEVLARYQRLLRLPPLQPQDFATWLQLNCG